MNARSVFFVGVVCSSVLASHAGVAQEAIPVVTLPPASTTSADAFGVVLGVRELPAGKLLVNDGARHQIKVLDASLASSTIILDSVRGAQNFYGLRGVPIIPYLADSTLFPRLQAGAPVMTVFGPDGSVARTLAMPIPAMVNFVNRGAIDPTGRMIFPFRPAITRLPGKGAIPPAIADSAPLLRADFVLRRTDTVGYFGRPMVRMDARRPTGAITSAWMPDPLRAVDEWAVLTDGSIAIVRSHDYHIDWIRPDGTRQSSPKLPFDWRQVTDDEKEKLIDSAHAQIVSLARSNTYVLRMEMQINWPPRITAAAGDKTPLPPGVERVQVNADTAGALYTQGAGDPVMILPSPRPTPDQVFDYYPPVRVGAAMADLDDHLWILPTTSKQSKAGELVYDVVNTKGELFERVRVPLGRFIVGFGQGGVVYLASGNLSAGFHVERSKLPAANAGTQ